MNGKIPSDDTVDRLRTVNRSIGLLKMFLNRDAVGLSDIKDELSVSKTAAFRLASTLLDSGFLIKDRKSKSYRLGPVFWELSRRQKQSQDLVGICDPYMQKLVSQYSESVYLSITAGNGYMFLYGIDGPLPIRYSFPLGRVESLHAGSAGKLHLAFLPKDQREAALRPSITKAFTAQTITNETVLRKRIEEIEKDGYCISLAEREPDTAGISVPIFAEAGEFVAGLSIMLPLSRYSDKMGNRFLKSALGAAKQISKNLNRSHSPFDLPSAEFA